MLSYTGNVTWPYNNTRAQAENIHSFTWSGEWDLEATWSHQLYSMKIFGFATLSDTLRKKFFSCKRQCWGVKRNIWALKILITEFLDYVRHLEFRIEHTSETGYFYSKNSVVAFLISSSTSSSSSSSSIFWWL